MRGWLQRAQVGSPENQLNARERMMSSGDLYEHGHRVHQLYTLSPIVVYRYQMHSVPAVMMSSPATGSKAGLCQFIFAVLLNRECFVFKDCNRHWIFSVTGRIGHVSTEKYKDEQNSVNVGKRIITCKTRGSWVSK